MDKIEEKVEEKVRNKCTEPLSLDPFYFCFITTTIL